MATMMKLSSTATSSPKSVVKHAETYSCTTSRSLFRPIAELDDPTFHVKALVIWGLAHAAAYSLEQISRNAASLMIYLPVVVALPFASNTMRLALAIGVLHGVCHILLPFLNKDKPMGVDPDFSPGWDLAIHLLMGVYAYASMKSAFEKQGMLTGFRRYMFSIMFGNLISVIMGFTVWTNPLGFDIMRYVTTCCTMNTGAFCAASMAYHCTPKNAITTFCVISAAVGSIHLILLGHPDKIAYLQDSRLFEVICISPALLSIFAENFMLTAGASQTKLKH